MSGVQPPGNTGNVDATRQLVTYRDSLSIDQIILMVDMQVQASQDEMRTYVDQQNVAVKVKKFLNDALAKLSQSGSGDLNDRATREAIASALKKAQDATTDPQLKARLQGAIDTLDKGNDDLVTSSEIASIQETLKSVGGDLDGEQQAVMLGLQAAIDRMKRITELGSNWIAKLDETANVAIRNMRAG